MMNLNVKNLSFIQDGVTVLNDITFSLEEKDILGVIGPNGSGKSTLLKVLAGTMCVDNKDFFVYKSSEYKKQVPDIGFVTEDPIVYHDLTVYQNYKITALAGNLSNNDVILDSIKLFGLNELIHRKTRSLSQGEKKRLSIGLAMLNNPQLLLFDEPQNGLDHYNNVIFREIINDKREGRIIIFSSHQFIDIQQLCTKVLFLKNGRAIFFKRLEDILSEYKSIEGFYRKFAYEKNIYS